MKILEKKGSLGRPRPAAGLGLLLLVAAYAAQGAAQTAPPDARGRKNYGKTSLEKRLKLERSLFFEKPALGTITAIGWNRAESDSPAVFVVAGNYGAAFVGSDGQTLSSVRLDRKAGKVVPVDMEGDGKLEYIDRSSTPGEVGLFDHQGRTVWKYGLGTEPEADDMACGDLDGDGRLECAVAMKGNAGLRLLDKNGKEQWGKADMLVWNVEILDADGDGKNEIVHSNAAGKLRIRNADGGLIRELATKDPITLFSTCRWPTADGGWHILNNNTRTGIQLFNFEGKIVTTFPTDAKGYEAIGTPVLFAGEEKPYFALLVCNCSPSRDSRLYIYNSDGENVYEEILPTPQAAFLAVADERPGYEALLVGENEGRVWRYRASAPDQSGRN